MRKLMPRDGRTCPAAFQQALDTVEVAGAWDWDIPSDLVRADTFVALLFNVDPEEAAIGLPLSAYIEGIHPEDREHVHTLIRRCIDEDAPFVAEYRVMSADGVTRWMLDRGHIMRDAAGRPTHGRGIIVDITWSRTGKLSPTTDDPAYSVSPLEQVADLVLAAHKVITQLQDPALKEPADALLMAIGRQLAQKELKGNRRRMN